MLHPVGPLPAAVYWRRRLLLLGLVLAVLAGGGWLTVVAVSGRDGGGGSVASGATGEADPSLAPPSLEQVVPSLASVQVPTVAPSPEPATETAAPPPAAPGPPGPAPGGPCSDDMISVQVRPPGGPVAVGSKPTLDLVVTNVSEVPCVRALDKNLQEIVLLESGGTRVWGSNDCFPEATDDTRTLAPGEAAIFPLVWGGLTSEPGCAAPRVTPAPGDYVLRGRLDTKTSGDAPIRLE
ncbi:MucR family transcriptional regulator [Modestobacter lapidis]|nr:MucR family transcriptional regulator [Modestobacter lapidis]